MIVKNSFGISAILGTRTQRKHDLRVGTCTGSSLGRNKKYKPKTRAKPKKPSVPKERSMSQRTRSKIRKKILAFSQIHKRLNFVTLTFVNQVNDEDAILIFRKFLDNMKKRKQNFEYLWVAERQNKNQLFPGNIHFHMITNSYLKIEPTWNYWLNLQAKNGIKPRNESFRPSSAFDVKSIGTKNPSSIGMYLTKYVTKNQEKFKCQVWNCSKGVSRLYTDFYSDYSYIEQLEKIYGKKMKEIDLEFCSLKIYPIDKNSIRLNHSLKVINTTIKISYVICQLWNPTLS